MPTARPPRTPPRSPDAADLERQLSAVERHLAALGESLRRHDSRHIEQQAHALRSALALTIDAFGPVARAGQVPAALRARLVQASTQAAVQREALLRTSLALDSALEVMLPRERPVVYEYPGGTVPPVFRH
jgi:predicted component of type VI protein secretion system